MSPSNACAVKKKDCVVIFLLSKCCNKLFIHVKAYFALIYKNTDVYNLNEEQKLTYLLTCRIVTESENSNTI